MELSWLVKFFKDFFFLTFVRTEKQANVWDNMFFRVLHCDSQVFIGKSEFLEKKAHFFGNKTVDQRFGAN